MDTGLRQVVSILQRVQLPRDTIIEMNVEAKRKQGRKDRVQPYDDEVDLNREIPSFPPGPVKVETPVFMYDVSKSPTAN